MDMILHYTDTPVEEVTQKLDSPENAMVLDVLTRAAFDALMWGLLPTEVS